MPKTKVVYYKESDGSVPVLNWLDEIDKRDKRIRAKCVAWIIELEDKGISLGRPLPAH